MDNPQQRRDPPYRLFYDDHTSALSAAVENNRRGLTPKQVASEVYAHLKPDSAYARLKSITNPDKDEKADLWEVKRICQVCERYEPLFWLCDELDHARPPRRAPQDRASELLQQFARGVEDLKSLSTQIDKAGGPAALIKLVADGGRSV